MTTRREVAVPSTTTVRLQGSAKSVYVGWACSNLLARVGRFATALMVALGASGAWKMRMGLMARSRKVAMF